MKEAMFFQRDKNNSVTCLLCSHRCRIVESGRGLCGVRENRGGVLFSLVYGRVVAAHVDPIEKKPLYHFLPGTYSYSIATVGCNFFCRHCQNYEISQYPHMHAGEITGTVQSADEIVDAAVRSGCHSISYTYVEPTIFYEFARDCMQLAHERGLANVFVSNGYMSAECTRDMAPLLDAINIDIKSFREEFYTRVCKAHVQPVLETVKLMKELGIWVEATTLLIPGLNDSPEELNNIASFIHSVDPAIPWHVTAFRPTYKLMDKAPTPLSSLQEARAIGRDVGLKFVYEGNISSICGEQTSCPGCGAHVLSRHGFSLKNTLLQNGKCSKCNESIPGVWEFE